ncbi:MAG: hypothetical protein IPM82_13210 [Saprospiraceae bacterium]|nr:hypothetical protein [Saprospiraceae bacterium]
MTEEIFAKVTLKNRLEVGGLVFETLKRFDKAVFFIHEGKISLDTRSKILNSYGVLRLVLDFASQYFYYSAC